MLMRVTGRIDCFRYVCALQTKIKYSFFFLCVLMFMYYYTACYFTCIFYAVARQISVLFIDSKDSAFCILCLQARDLQTTAEEQYRQELAAQTRLANLYKVCVSHLCQINIGYFFRVVS